MIPALARAGSLSPSTRAPRRSRRPGGARRPRRVLPSWPSRTCATKGSPSHRRRHLCGLHRRDRSSAPRLPGLPRLEVPVRLAGLGAGRSLIGGRWELADRVREGAVTDFIDLPLCRPSTSRTWRSRRSPAAAARRGAIEELTWRADRPLDDDLAVIEKPAGVVVTRRLPTRRDAGRPAGGHRGRRGGERPGIVHRLDKDTSGRCWWLGMRSRTRSWRGW